MPSDDTSRPKSDRRGAHGSPYLLKPLLGLRNLSTPLRIGLAFTGLFLITFFLFDRFVDDDLVLPAFEFFGTKPNAVTIVVLYALFAAGLLFANFVMIEKRLLEQDALYQDIKDFDEAPEIQFVILRLRKRSDKARRSGWIALFSAIAIIALAIAILLRTIEQVEIPQAEREKVAFLEQLIPAIDAAREEANSLAKPSAELAPNLIRVPTVAIENLDKYNLSKHPSNWALLASLIPEVDGPKITAKLSRFSASQQFLKLENEDRRSTLRSYSVQLSLIQKRASLQKERSERALKPKSNGNVDSSISTQNLGPILVRFGAVFILMFLTQTLINLYRYNIRISAFYDSRADILELSDVVPEVLQSVSEILSPDQYDFGKPAKTPAQYAVELAKEIVSQGGKAVRRS